MNDIDKFFHFFSKKISEMIGHPITFFLGLLIVTIWLIGGVFFGFTDTWQLIINTITSIITFLIVFLIQNTQNREIADIKIKIAELIRSRKSAKNEIINLEDLPDKKLNELMKKYQKLGKKKISGKLESDLS